MTIPLYVFVEIFAVVFMMIAENYKNKNNKRYAIFWMIFSMVILAFLVCFRHVSVGKDTQSYCNAYLRIANGIHTQNDINWLGNAFILALKVISFVAKNNYYIFLAIMGLTTLIFFYSCIYQNSKKMWLSLFLLISFGLYFQMFNQARQMLAIAIVFYSIKYIEKRDLKKYIIFILIASCIHNSAIVMLPFYYISNIKLNRKSIFIYMIIAIASFLLFDVFEKILGNVYYWKAYVNTGYNRENVLTSILNLGIRVALLTGCLFFYKKVLKENKEAKYLYNMAIWCTIIQVITLKSYLFARVTTYFFVFYILLIPEVINAVFKNRNNKLFVELIVIIAFIIYEYIYYAYGTGAIGYGYDVYKFLWNG